MKVRKKPVEVDAVRWFKNGDHPEDYDGSVDGIEDGQLRTFTGRERKERGWEGGVVRYFRRPDVSGADACRECGGTMHDHGWIDTREGGHIVCPGDWIITGVKGEHYPCKPDIFELTYERIDKSESDVLPIAGFALLDPASATLDVAIKKNKLVISIGVGALAFAVSQGEWAYDGIGDAYRLRITDAPAFAKLILDELCVEDGDSGLTPVHRLLDAAAEKAAESGGEGYELDPVTVDA